MAGEKVTERGLTYAQEADINEELRVLIGGFATRYGRAHGLDPDAVNAVLKEWIWARVPRPPKRG